MNDISSASNRFPGTSISWDGDSFPLPREMLCSLPTYYPMQSYLHESQEEMEGIFSRMRQNYAPSEGVLESQSNQKTSDAAVSASERLWS